MDLLEGIRRSYLAEGLRDSEVAQIVTIAHEVSFTNLHEIVREEDEADDLYILLTGKALVTTGMGDPIARLKPGSVLGELALFERGPRSATVVSEGESTAVRLNAKEFNALMDAHPHIGLTVLRNLGTMLCSRLRSSNVQLESVLSALEA